MCPVCILFTMSFLRSRAMAGTWATPDEVQCMEDILLSTRVRLGELPFGTPESVIEREWRVFRRQKRLLAVDRLLFVAALPGGHSRKHRVVLGWCFDNVMAVQLGMAKPRCLGV
jgi:hypothetical protein